MHCRVMLLLALSLIACRRPVPNTAADSTSSWTTTAVSRSVASIHSATGAALGNLRLDSGRQGVHITGTVVSLAPGRHGIHFHAVGSCEATGFATAGGHFNPGGTQHGLENPAGPHAGDLPDILAGPDSAAVVDLTTKRVSFDSTLAGYVFDADGTALVIHADPDDQRSDPSGNSGTRVGCGVVRRA